MVNKMLKRRRDQKGIAVVLVAGMTVMFLAFAALSIDIAHLYVVQNELQNAADAGALAGGRRLYYPNGSSVNLNANQIAYEAAIENTSEKIAVEVISPNTNAHDVQRGHWSFSTRAFTASNSTEAPHLWDKTTAELDVDTSFVNAIKVTARRQQSQANSFFARIMGFAGFDVSAEAIAYIGYAGTIAPMEIDTPIAVCKQAISSQSNTEYSCATGRMMNATVDTAAWTNFSQPCDTADANELGDMVCVEPGANLTPVVVGHPMGTNNGQVNDPYLAMLDCWENDPSLDTDGDGVPDQPWNLVFPVIDCCPEDNPNCNPDVGNCMKFVGIAAIDVLWISGSGVGHVFAPNKMGDWTCPAGYDEDQCWADLTQHFNIRNYDDSYPDLEQKSLYFKPSCDADVPVGVTGGKNFGVLAKIPVLVN
jgi:Flp pilus assembly protein TadG